MKRLLLILCLLSAPVWAEDCAGGAGTIIAGLNGKRYCLSNIRMNWYSAFSWCEAAGGHLASLNEACQYNGAAVVGEACSNKPNIFSVDYAWLSSVQSNNSAKVLQNWQNNNVFLNSHGFSSNMDFALCAGSY